MTDPRTPEDEARQDQLLEEASLWFARMRGPEADINRPAFNKWLARGAAHLGAYNRAAEIFSMGSLTVSPDGTRIAYRVVSRSVAANRTSVEWFAAPIDQTAPPIRMGRTAEPIWIPMFDMIEDGSVA